MIRRYLSQILFISLALVFIFFFFSLFLPLFFEIPYFFICLITQFIALHHYILVLCLCDPFVFIYEVPLCLLSIFVFLWSWQAETEADRMDWVNKITGVITSLLNSHLLEQVSLWLLTNKLYIFFSTANSERILFRSQLSQWMKSLAQTLLLML